MRVDANGGQIMALPEPEPPPAPEQIASAAASAQLLPEFTKLYPTLSEQWAATAYDRHQATASSPGQAGAAIADRIARLEKLGLRQLWLVPDPLAGTKERSAKAKGTGGKGAKKLRAVGKVRSYFLVFVPTIREIRYFYREM
eukprot:SAG31_NODE_2199_length_6208_cov_3.935996_2_plen_142_part_00